jgi:hypothetical protein
VIEKLEARKSLRTGALGMCPRCGRDGRAAPSPSPSVASGDGTNIQGGHAWPTIPPAGTRAGTSQRDVPTIGGTVRTRTPQSVLDLEFLAILMFGHWSFFAPINGIGVRAWFLEIGVSLCLSGRTRSEPGRQVGQTRLMTGFDRVCPGLPGFDRVKFQVVAPG